MANAPSEPTSTTATLRARLIACATSILEESGIDALTLRAAARAAGVSHMAPYRHFEDKEALLAAVAEAGFLDLGTDMTAAAAAQAEPLARLQAIGRAYMDFALRRPAIYRLMFGSAALANARHAGLAAAADKAFAACAQAVAACRAPSDPGDDAPWTLIIATWSLVHGLASLLIDGRIPLPDDPRARRDLIDAVLEVHGSAFEQHPTPPSAFDASDGSP